MPSKIQDVVLKAVKGQKHKSKLYCLQGKAWVHWAFCLRVRDLRRDRYSSGVLFLEHINSSHEAIVENWTFAAHHELLDGIKTFRVPLVLDDHAPGVTSEMKKAGLNPIFVYTYLFDRDEFNREENYYNEDFDAYVRNTYKGIERRSHQPKTTHLAFFNENDAVVAQGILDMMYNDDDEFAKAS